MNKQKIVSRLQKKYPGKKIICLPEDNPSEIICEIITTAHSPLESVAISIIDQSAPHVHHHTNETYEVLDGGLTVYIDGAKHVLKSGDSMHIPPGKRHYAAGNETWVKCTAKPGWVAEDHILIEANT